MSKQIENEDTVATPIQGRSTLKDQGKTILDAIEGPGEKATEAEAKAVGVKPAPKSEPLPEEREVPVSEMILDDASDLLRERKAVEEVDQIAYAWSPIFDQEVTPKQVALALAQVGLVKLLLDSDDKSQWAQVASFAALGAEVDS